MSDIKLTKAQREWLELVARAPNGRRMCDASYRPHIALVSLGLAAADSPKYTPRGTVTVITAAGREWLARHMRKK